MKNKIREHVQDYLSEFVYGGIDGSITTFAVVSGATGAGLSTSIVIILGFANLIADGFSMGVGSYLSAKSKIEMERKRGAKATAQKEPWIDGLSTYVAFILFGLVPLLAYVYDFIFKANLNHLFLYSCILTGTAFISIGFMKSKVAQTSKIRGVTETLLLGLIASVFAYSVGNILEKTIR